MSERVERYIVDEYALDPGAVTVEVREVSGLSDMLPSDSIEVIGTSESVPRGASTIRLNVWRAGRLARTLYVPVKVRHFAEVYTAGRRIKAGEEIAVEDLVRSRCEVTYLVTRALPCSDSVGELRARRTIPDGRVIEIDMVESVPLIHRGDEITIVSTSGTLRVSARGVAAQDGCKGDRIAVYNKSTRKKLSCEVADAGTVIVRR